METACLIIAALPRDASREAATTYRGASFYTVPYAITALTNLI
jgi:hypothetical protein